MTETKKSRSGRPSRSARRDAQRTREEELVSIFHALSEPNRLAVVRRLANGDEVPCADFDSGLTRGTWSYHFKILREAGLTSTRNSGVERLLSLRIDDIGRKFPGLLEIVAGSGSSG